MDNLLRILYEFFLKITAIHIHMYSIYRKIESQNEGPLTIGHRFRIIYLQQCLKIKSFLLNNDKILKKLIGVYYNFLRKKIILNLITSVLGKHHF
jgi:hypothetical protein